MKKGVWAIAKDYMIHPYMQESHLKTSENKTMKKSLLVDGKIPANTECPFRDKCNIAKNNECKHNGKNHEVEFSCASARFMDKFGI